MAHTFKLDIITPYRVFYSGDAEMIIIDSVDGELGIMADHAPVVAPVEICAGKIKIGGEWKRLAMSNGFIEMERNRVVLLVGAAEWPEEIDIARAEASLKRAKTRLEDTSMPWVSKRAEDARRRATVRLQVASGLRDAEQ